MSAAPAAFTFGMEEEFFLIDLRTRNAVPRVSKGFVAACRSRLGDAVTFELQQTQVEVVSPVFTDPAEALREMARVRSCVAEVANGMGLGIIAAGSHPLARWHRHRHTEKPRYDRLIDTFQMIGRRDVLCGLHIHVAVPDGDRVKVMNRLMPWLPLFLALSTSSPFWSLRRTGLLSYRQAVYDEWPRTGIPDFFDDQADYDAFIARLVRAGAIKDGSELWWAIRPSPRFPTLELRIADSCTRLQDAVALATLFRCLVSAYVRQPHRDEQRSNATRRLIDENRWRAQRYGLATEFIIEGDDRTQNVTRRLDAALDLVAADARTLDPDGMLETLRSLLARGTSAHEQLARYERSREAGANHIEALRCVVDWLAETTAPGQQTVS